ncbi:MAG: SpoIID/LytB domain-containing protein, partial [Calditrichia bacterium]
PYEIPSNNPEYYPAVAAQAVAARTYAISRMNLRLSEPFHVYGDTRDQVYRGFTRPSPMADQAVEKTAGMVLLGPDGRAAVTQYHSTCGGYLEPLLSQSLLAEGSGLREDVTDGSFNCAVSPLYRWTEKITAATLLRNLQRIGKIASGEIKQLAESGYRCRLEILERQPSGRVDKIRIYLNDEYFDFSGWEIRQVLAGAEEQSLSSRLFFMKDSPGDSSLFYIVGAGYGHGRGMCQWGAVGQAMKGRSWQDILHFYYPDLQLAREHAL